MDETGRPAGASGVGSHGMDERDEAASSDGTRWNTGTNGVQGPGLDALAGSWRPPAVGRAGVPVSADVEPDHVIRGRAEVRAPYADLLPQPPEAFPPPNGSQPTNRHVNGVRLPAQPQPDNRSAYDQPYYDRPRYDQPYTGEAYHQPPAAPPPPNYFTPMRDLEASAAAPPRVARHAEQDTTSPWETGGIPAARTTPPPHYDEAPVYPEPSRYPPAAAQWPRTPEPPPWSAEPPQPAAPWAEPPRHRSGILPQRVPAEPDVPDVPDEPESADGPPAETPELTRIATYLRDEDEDAAPVRPEGFDIPAVLAAVRQVSGVREALLRTNPGGVHTLRLELADDADPAKVSREVARLLKVRMGLAAEPNAAAPLKPHSAPPMPPLANTRESRRAPAWTGRDQATRADEPSRAVARTPTGGGRLTAYEPAPEGGSARPLPGGAGGPRIVIDQVEVGTQGSETVVEVRLTADGSPSYGVASGPAFDGYVLRLAAVAAANAVDELLADQDGTARGRCYVEHATVVPLGTCEVAVVVLLLACGGWVEQLAGSAVVGTDARHAVVRATLSAVNRRIEALLP